MIGDSLINYIVNQYKYGDWGIKLLGLIYEDGNLACGLKRCYIMPNKSSWGLGASNSCFLFYYFFFF